MVCAAAHRRGIRANRACGRGSVAPGWPGSDAARGPDALRRTPGVGSWLDTFWPYRYLGRRDRIALNANFFFLFGADTRWLARRPLAAGRRCGARPVRCVRYAAGRAGGGDHHRSGELQTSARHRERPAGAAARPAADHGAEQVPVLRHPNSRGRRRTPSGCPTPFPGPARRGPVTSRCSSAGTRSGSTCCARMAALCAGRSRGGAAGVMRRSGPGRAWHLARPPHYQGAGGVGGQPSDAAGLRPSQRRPLDTIETALFCLCLEDFAPRGAGDVRPPAARRQRQPLVRQGRVADRLRRRFRRDQRRALRPGRHDHPQFIDDLLTTPGRRCEASRGAPRAPNPSSSCFGDALQADITAAATSFADYGAATATTRCRSKTSAPTGQAAGVSPDGFVAAGLPARAPAGQGAHGRDLRVHRHPAVPTGGPRRCAWSPPSPGVRGGHGRSAADAATRRQRCARGPQAHVARAEGVPGRRRARQHLWELQLIQRRRGASSGAVEPALYQSPGWPDHARRLPEHQLRAVRQHPVFRLRVRPAPTASASRTCCCRTASTST